MSSDSPFIGIWHRDGEWDCSAGALHGGESYGWRDGITIETPNAIITFGAHGRVTIEGDIEVIE